MNLVHLFEKKDRNLSVSANVTRVTETLNGRVFVGFRLPPGEHVKVQTALKWYPFSTRPPTTSWLAKLPGTHSKWKIPPEDRAPRIAVSLGDREGNVVSETSVPVTPAASPVDLPRLTRGLPKADEERLDLVLSNPSSADVVVLVTEHVPVSDLYKEATGTGAELGPGPNPRILPSETCEVYYLERETIDEWQAKYSGSKLGTKLPVAESKSLWSRYKVGCAHELPFEDGSLDFIFSAHVFEHLVNPLGHLAYWKTKLTPKGKIIAIVPQLHGCGDYRNRPTSLDSLLEQYKLGGFVETIEHHRKYAEARNNDPAVSFAKKVSIHISFFNQENLADLSSWSVDKLGFRSYSLIGGMNPKILRFTLDV